MLCLRVLQTLHCTASTRSWTLYWRGRNLRFHVYDHDRFRPSQRMEDLPGEIDRNPTSVFWR